MYQFSDQPFHYHANKILIFVAVYNIILLIAMKRFYAAANWRRENIWNSMSGQQRRAYLATKWSEGNKRLDFRFAH